MATAKKLPSGNWRCLVYDYTDENGKKKYKSFTAPTKKAAELAAAQYNASVKVSRTDLTVAQAIERYISSKENVLSPATIRGYRQMQKAYYDEIGSISIYKLSNERLQRFVSSISEDVKAKTVSNVYGLLSATLRMYRPEAAYRITMPKKVKPRKDAPSSLQVKKLFLMAEGDMKICIALAAYGSMRRGEICGLKYGDITGNMITIHADMVENKDNKFEYKEMPKTGDSCRIVQVPEKVIALIGTGPADEFVVKRTPNAVTHAFTRLRDRVGLSICFHDLRHHFASIGAVLGIPDTYMSDFGGWRRGSSVLKAVYQNSIEVEKTKYQNQMAEYFSDMMSG